VCKESENGSPDCSVYAHPRATEVRRRHLGSPVRFCWVRELGKLYELLAKLTEGQAQLGCGWSELAAVAEAWAVMAGGGKLAGAKEGHLTSEGERGVR
jgi:hypothetical protein